MTATMTATMRWPDGTTATFDGRTWTSTSDVWTAADLGAVPVRLSRMVEDYAWWAMADVAREVGAEPTTEPPSAGPRMVADVGEYRFEA